MALENCDNYVYPVVIAEVDGMVVVVINVGFMVMIKTEKKQQQRFGVTMQILSSGWYTFPKRQPGDTDDEVEMVLIISQQEPRERAWLCSEFNSLGF